MSPDSDEEEREEEEVRSRGTNSLQRRAQLIGQQHGGQQEEDRPRPAVVSGQRREMLAGNDLDQELVRFGFANNKDLMVADVKRITRDMIFKKVKFAQPEALAVDGHIAKMLRKEMSYSGDAHDRAFATAWERWMRKTVMKAIGNKRASCSQAIARSVKKVIRQQELAFAVVSWRSEDLELIVEEKRKDVEKYRWFYDNVLNHVVGRNLWKKNEKETDGSVMASVSDEALALLLLENGWEVWQAECAGGGDEEEGQEGGGVLPDTKYTMCSRGCTSGTDRGKIKGWKDEGLERFNKLFQEVKADRKEHGRDFDDMYKEGKRRNAGQKRKRSAMDRSTVVAMNEFTSDEDGSEAED